MNRSYCVICRSRRCSNWSCVLINIRKKVSQRYFSYFQELRLQHMIELCDSIEVETKILHIIFKGYFMLKYGNGWSCVSYIDTFLVIMRTGHFHLFLRRQQHVWFFILFGLTNEIYFKQFNISINRVFNIILGNYSCFLRLHVWSHLKTSKACPCSRYRLCHCSTNCMFNCLQRSQLKGKRNIKKIKRHSKSEVETFDDKSKERQGGTCFTTQQN